MKPTTKSRTYNLQSSTETKSTEYQYYVIRLDDRLLAGVELIRGLVFSDERHLPMSISSIKSATDIIKRHSIKERAQELGIQELEIIKVVKLTTETYHSKVSINLNEKRD